jgi:hypothetical protein
MTVTQAEQPWSGRLLLAATTMLLLLLLLVVRVVVWASLWWCGISSYSLSLSTPLSVRSKQNSWKHRYTFFP